MSQGPQLQYTPGMADELQPVVTVPRVEKRGRRKGVPNKATTTRKTAEQICKEMGIDPIQSLAWIIQNKDMVTGQDYIHKHIDPKTGEIVSVNGYTDELRQSTLRELNAYVHPKKKAIEHTGGDGKPLAPPELHVHFV